MKNFIKIISCLLLISSLTACGLNEEIVESEKPVLESIETETNSINIPEIVTDEQKEKDLDVINQMLPLMDSIMLCMFENNYEFNTEDVGFIWNVMAYYVGNHLINSEKITFSEDNSSAIVSKEDVYGYMKGYIINDIHDFEEREDIFLITENQDSYSFGLGDRGLSKSEIISFSKNIDNSFDVDIKLIGLDDNSEICTASFHLENIDDETRYFPMVITNAIIQNPQPSIQIGTIVEINEENVILEINGEKKMFFFNENSKQQVKTKTVGNSIDIMIDKDIIINILN